MNGLEIKKARKKLGLTQEDLAEIMKVSVNTIYNYENGSNIPKNKATILRKILELSDNQKNIKDSLIEDSLSTYLKNESEETKLAISTFESMLDKVNTLISRLEKIETITVADMTELRKAYKLRDEIAADIRDYKNK